MAEKNEKKPQAVLLAAFFSESIVNNWKRADVISRSPSLSFDYIQ